jgi:2'-5' RNA ligase
MEKRHRIFVAINLPEEIKKELAKYEEKWPELPAKWVAKDNLHITLEFLGHLTDLQLAEVCSVVAEVAKNHKQFSINLTNILYGPLKKMPPKMIWAQGEKIEELTDLRNDMEEYLLEKVNFRPEGRGFVPHITLARISEFLFRQIEPEERPEVEENLDLTFYVESIEVMESELTRQGPRYTIIESHELRA